MASLKVAAGVTPVLVFVLVVDVFEVLDVFDVIGSPVVGSVSVEVTGRPVFGSIVLLGEVLLVLDDELATDAKMLLVSPFTSTVVATPIPLSGFSSSNGT
jgi:hypothetical protein